VLTHIFPCLNEWLNGHGLVNRVHSYPAIASSCPAGTKLGLFTSVVWQVTLCDPIIKKVTSRSFEMTWSGELNHFTSVLDNSATLQIQNPTVFVDTTEQT